MQDFEENNDEISFLHDEVLKNIQEVLCYSKQSLNDPEKYVTLFKFKISKCKCKRKRFE